MNFPELTTVGGFHMTLQKILILVSLTTLPHLPCSPIPFPFISPIQLATSSLYNNIILYFIFLEIVLFFHSTLLPNSTLLLFILTNRNRNLKT